MICSWPRETITVALTQKFANDIGSDYDLSLALTDRN